MSKLIFPELSYQIMGIVFDVYNKLGHGYQEKYYQKAIAHQLKKNKIKFVQQVKTDLVFDNEIIGKYYLDFLINNKIVLELKVGDYFYQKDYEQIRSYLKTNKLQLGILALITKTGVKSKRILCKY